MNNDLRNKCHAIIHSHAALAAAGNAVPVPGLGCMVDVATMTTMAMSLASALGGDISESVARNMAIATLKRQILAQPLKVIAKELSKFIPFAGQIASATVSMAMLEAAGWALVNELSERRACLSAASA